MEITLTSENFEKEVLSSDVPVLVDFWAEWCGPCKMTAPAVKELADEADGYKVGKVNVDNEPELTARFGIDSIPALYLFKDGKTAETMIGYHDKKAIADMIARNK
jgi:thioredoxin 1